MKELLSDGKDLEDFAEEKHPDRADLIRGQLLAIARLKENMDTYRDAMIEFHKEPRVESGWTDEEIYNLALASAFEKVYSEIDLFLNLYKKSIKEDYYLKDLIKFEGDEDENRNC